MSTSELDGHPKRLAAFNFRRNGIAALNVAFASHISVIVIPKDTSFADPINLGFAAAEGMMLCPHLIVIAEAGSKATLVETYASPAAGFMNSAIQIFVEDNANLTHYRVQKESVNAFHYGVTEISVGRGSYTIPQISISAEPFRGTTSN